MSELDSNAQTPIQQYTPSSRILNQAHLEQELELELQQQEEQGATRALSRPPSYIPHESIHIGDPAHQQRHLEILSELGEYYDRQDRRSHYLSRLLFWNTGSSEEDENTTARLSYKDALFSCFQDQFKGVMMAFWIIVFIFIGAISVFLPTLPRGSQAMWLPLILYMIVAFILFRHRYKQSARIDRLERQVLEERRRRRRNEIAILNEQNHQRQLPTGYFFEIHYDDKEHTHPYRTLLKPPPTYTNS